MACLLGGMMAAGIGCVAPESVVAAPLVSLGYGEHSYDSWYVDIGSIMRDGAETTVHVSLDSEHSEDEYRIYHFNSANGWKYYYDAWTGNGSRKKGGNRWSSVSSNQLANDILYVVQNH